MEGLDQTFSAIVGKGFRSVHHFINNSHNKANKQCEFNVKMFSKQLYGQIENNTLNHCSYGNWEFSLSFKDELQGRLKHNFKDFDCFGPEPFYFAI
jgi:hypothetical protein